MEVVEVRGVWWVGEELVEDGHEVMQRADEGSGVLAGSRYTRRSAPSRRAASTSSTAIPRSRLVHTGQHYDEKLSQFF